EYKSKGSDSKKVVTLDASSQAKTLENTPLYSQTSTVIPIPINIRETSGYREGLDLAGFCVTGHLENRTPTESSKSKESSGGSEAGGSKGATSEKAVMLAAVVSSKPDLKQDEIKRVVHKSMKSEGYGSESQYEKEHSKTGDEQGKTSETSMA